MRLAPNILTSLSEFQVSLDAIIGELDELGFARYCGIYQSGLPSVFRSYRATHSEFERSRVLDYAFQLDSAVRPMVEPGSSPQVLILLSELKALVAEFASRTEPLSPADLKAALEGYASLDELEVEYQRWFDLTQSGDPVSLASEEPAARSLRELLRRAGFALRLGANERGASALEQTFFVVSGTTLTDTAPRKSHSPTSRATSGAAQAF